ncbi:MAG: NfeD family protein [Alphaproteobacteria bacterium]|nr:NfeD family protein [Alphaproteobacteria bacterium]
MYTFFDSLGAWNWFIAGGLLLALEALAPGVFMFWLGLAAMLVGAISMVVDWSWQAQFIAFAIFSVAMIPLYHRLSFAGATTDQPFLNRRADALVGRVFTLERPIVDGAGTVRIDDSVWRITGPDIPAGRRIKVVAIDGTALHVELVTER